MHHFVVNVISVAQPVSIFPGIPGCASMARSWPSISGCRCWERYVITMASSVNGPSRKCCWAPLKRREKIEYSCSQRQPELPTTLENSKEQEPPESAYRGQWK